MLFFFSSISLQFLCLAVAVLQLSIYYVDKKVELGKYIISFSEFLKRKTGEHLFLSDCLFMRESGPFAK